MSDNSNLNVQEILMKLVESNARIEAKLDTVDKVICELKRESTEMEHRLDDVERNIDVIKTKLIVATFVMSIIISVVASYITKTIIGE